MHHTFVCEAGLPLGIRLSQSSPAKGNKKEREREREYQLISLTSSNCSSLISPWVIPSKAFLLISSASRPNSCYFVYKNCAVATALPGARAVRPVSAVSAVHYRSLPRDSLSGGGLLVEFSGSGRHDTIKSRIIEQCAMSLELPPLVRPGVFFLFFYVSQRG